MFRTFGLVILGLSLLVSAAATQDKKDPPKIKGQLPSGFKDLGLSKAQIEKIYSIQTDFRGKIAELQAKVNELKKSETKEVFGVLTEEQRDKYLKAEGVETKGKKDGDKDKVKDK